jgi:ABC-type Fe3+ transport system permease subunit
MHIKILGWLFLNGEITDDLFTFYFLFIYFPLIFFFFNYFRLGPSGSCLQSEIAEIRKMVVQSQLGQIVLETLSQAGAVSQGVGPEFKP